MAEVGALAVCCWLPVAPPTPSPLLPSHPSGCPNTTHASSGRNPAHWPPLSLSALGHADHLPRVAPTPNRGLLVRSAEPRVPAVGSQLSWAWAADLKSGFGVIGTRGRVRTWGDRAWGDRHCACRRLLFWGASRQAAGERRPGAVCAGGLSSPSCVTAVLCSP